MLIIKQISNRLSIFILNVVFASLFLFSQFVYAAATIPDAVTPGGALPQSFTDKSNIPTDADTLLIPKVIDRPLGVDEGERVRVKEFNLRGVQNYSSFGIRIEDVAFIAEANRVKRQRLDVEDMEGFTPDEVSNISEFIRQLVEEPNQRPTSADLWKLVFKLRSSEWKRGLTIGQMQEVADEITRYYRQKGLILATAFLPAQDVVDGKVVIEVLEGKLGRTQSESNSMYSSDIISRPFKSLKNKAITKDTIETGLLYLSDYPGLNISGILQPGQNHGESDLILKVNREKRFAGTIGVDNHGSEFTGTYRSRLDFSINNPSGYADQLNFIALLSNTSVDDLLNSQFGGINYSLPLLRSDWAFGTSVTYNKFTVGQIAENQFNIEGTSRVVGLSLKKIFSRRRGNNSYGVIEFNRKHSESLKAVTVETTDEYDSARVEFGFDMIDTRFAGINVGVVQLTQGLGSDLGADGFDDDLFKPHFQKINFNFSRLQTLLKNTSLLFTSQLQYTPQRLGSLEQFSLGGSNSVRAYPVSEYLRDLGYFVSLELIVNAPGFASVPAFAGRRWGEILNFSLFLDAGGGKLVDARASEKKEVHLQGGGVGVKLQLPNQFRTRFQVAQVLGNEEPINNGSKLRYSFDVQYYF